LGWVRARVQARLRARVRLRVGLRLHLPPADIGLLGVPAGPPPGRAGASAAPGAAGSPMGGWRVRGFGVRVWVRVWVRVRVRGFGLEG
jgi:hypothetical protein